MYQNDEDMYEVNDLDEDIKQREALLEEVKSIPKDMEWKDVASHILELKRKWKRIAYWESAYEDKLNDEFETCLDHFYAKHKEGLEEVAKIKKDIISQAKAICSKENLKQASSEMNDLMIQWKHAGNAGKEIDDELWVTFNSLRKEFFDRKQQNWESMQAKYANARIVKEEIIKKAEELKDSVDWQKSSEAYRDLMQEWKVVGSAGKAYEDDLWNRFNESRQYFYAQRDAHYEAVHASFEDHYVAKSALLIQAKAIADKEEYNKEDTNQMKCLQEEWKHIGTCGQAKEHAIWKEFRTFIDAYFDGLKSFNEQKHVLWKQHMQETRNRKQELIQKQKRQIQYMQNEIIGLIGERAINDMEENIAANEAFIKQLEREIEDIDKALEKR